LQNDPARTGDTTGMDQLLSRWALDP